jgi:uncharacterized protein YdbL (DUF1318 family)
MKKLTLSLSLLLVFSVISCVTINIYFPAEELRGAADKIVEEVWGEPSATPIEAAPKPPGSSFLQLLQPATAYAAQDINISTPEIRAVKDAIKARSGELVPLLTAGYVGIANDGLLKVRSTDGMNLKQRGQANQLVSAENQDRLLLYKEIAVANGFPEKVDEIRSIFADSWREQAHTGWYLEKPDGSWAAK